MTLVLEKAKQGRYGASALNEVEAGTEKTLLHRTRTTV